MVCIAYLHKIKNYYYIAEGHIPKHIKSLGKISKQKAEQKLKEFKQQLEIKPIYRTIVIDPPWHIEKIKRRVAPNQIDMNYELMNTEQIKQFPIPKFVDKDGAFLFIWTIQKYLPETFEIIKHWNFNYVCTMVWHKNGGFQPFNLPQYNCEFVVYANRGNLKFPSTKNFFCCFNGQRREHSRKPIEFYDTLRRVTPEPRIDIFSREKKEGFDNYGYEANKF